MMRAIWRQQQGFTLIELLIVVAIIGILAGIAVPRISESLDSAKVNSCQSNRAAIESAAELYRFKESEYPENVETLVSAGYFRKEPKCPSGGTYSIHQTTGAVTCDATGHN
ncbi:MAG: prepilin-type N-terminal cleavage/methylation domain-containing protein [Firmicutes bacterium]|nr:prepilin-type N-terminal cleavage/methylation domain-containing protein [Bacillota bacterium]